jgi:hypothetical protein
MTTADRTVYWRCFHCGDTFTRAQEKWAREHFGRTEDETPVCLIRSAGEAALLTALRSAQEELARYRSEDSDVIRSMLAMAADHQRELRRAEELGYAHGVRDLALLKARPDVADL